MHWWYITTRVLRASTYTTVLGRKNGRGRKISNLGASQRKLAGSFVLTHRSQSQPDPRVKLNSIAGNTGFSVLNWLRNVIKCIKFILEPIKHTKLVFSAILLSFGQGSGWDQLLCVITELLPSFLRPVPRFDPLCMGACNVRPPLMPPGWCSYTLA